MTPPERIVAQGGDDAARLRWAFAECVARPPREKELSVLAAAHRLGIPVTVHIGVGYDIIHEHPNADGASAVARATATILAGDAIKGATVRGAVVQP